MSDDLLGYFNRELNTLRVSRQEFAERHKEIAERLRLTADANDDPHISRLIDSFAFLTARIQRKLDDEFSEISDSLLGVLYPHLLAPVPSMSIMQIGVQDDLAGCYHVDSGRPVEVKAINGETCRFRTGYPLDLWPIRIEQAAVLRKPAPAPANKYAPKAVGVLKLSLVTTNEKNFSDLQLDRLRFFLPGESALARALYEQIFARTLSIAVAERHDDVDVVFLDRKHLHEVGFSAEEALLPFGAASAHSYQILTEYFAFPAKFLFFEISGLAAKTLGKAGRKLEIYLYVDRINDLLENTVSVGSFALGCTPIINVFSQRAEPIKLTEYLYEYRVVADVRRQQTTEIYSIDRVIGTGSGGRGANFTAFYRPEHDRSDPARRYWHASRREVGADRRSELFLSLVDLGFDPAQQAGLTLSIETTCFNGDVPRQLGDRATVILVDGGSAIAGIKLLTRPTQVLRPSLSKGGRWQLISHLTLNHLSLSAHPDFLKEMLRLYDVQNSAETRNIIQGIERISAKPSTARVPEAPAGVCRGLEFELEMADALAASGDGYLLAAILDRVFASYATLNSFSRLSLRFSSSLDPVRRWPARSGTKLLL